MNYRLGWIRDFADIRDFHVKHEEVLPYKLEEAPLEPECKIAILPPIKNQDQLGSCTANAGTYMYETFALQLQGAGTVPALSRLFLYKATRRLEGSKGDTGAQLRDTMKSLVLFGLPPESYWPYDISKFDNDPTAFEYSMAQNYQAQTYYRLDPQGKDAESVIASIKLNLAANRACIFGFTVYHNCMNNGNGNVRLPGLFDFVDGGHAICAVGYDDTRVIEGSTGAFIFANSWGTVWGDAGFGYLPYDYVRKGLATDWWTMMNGEWVNLDVFK